MVLIIFLYSIMCAVTFASTFLGMVMLNEFIDANMFGIGLPSVLSAIFWPVGLPISIGMIAVALIIKRYKGE